MAHSLLAWDVPEMRKETRAFCERRIWRRMQVACQAQKMLRLIGAWSARRPPYHVVAQRCPPWRGRPLALIDKVCRALQWVRLNKVHLRAGGAGRDLATRRCWRRARAALRVPLAALRQGLNGAMRQAVGRDWFRHSPQAGCLDSLAVQGGAPQKNQMAALAPGAAQASGPACHRPYPARQAYLAQAGGAACSSMAAEYAPERHVPVAAPAPDRRPGLARLPAGDVRANCRRPSPSPRVLKRAARAAAPGNQRHQPAPDLHVHRSSADPDAVPSLPGPRAYGLGVF